MKDKHSLEVTIDENKRRTEEEDSDCDFYDVPEVVRFDCTKKEDTTPTNKPKKSEPDKDASTPSAVSSKSKLTQKKPKIKKELKKKIKEEPSESSQTATTGPSIKRHKVVEDNNPFSASLAASAGVLAGSSSSEMDPTKVNLFIYSSSDLTLTDSIMGTFGSLVHQSSIHSAT